ALVADMLAGLHLVADLHLRTAHGVVPVVGPQAGAVVQVDTDAGLAGDGVPADPLHHTRQRRVGRSSAGDIDAGVEAAPAGPVHRCVWALGWAVEPAERPVVNGATELGGLLGYPLGLGAYPPSNQVDVT